MRTNAKPLVLAAAAMVVLSVLGPAAAALDSTTLRDADDATVTTEPATDVTDSSATLHGNLTAPGVGNATVWFEYWEEGDPANRTATASETLNGTGDFEATATGLEPNTTYVYVARAGANGSITDGGPVSFTTDPAAVVAVTTTGFRNVTNASATLTGELTTLEDAGNATVGFEYWQRDDPGNASTTAGGTLNGTGDFEATATGLAPDTVYVFRAHAEAEGVEDRGRMFVFTTQGTSDLRVSTLAATNVTNASATLNGELADLGGAGNATVGFEYWGEGDPGNVSTAAGGTLNGTGDFEATATGLEPNTTYVYVARADAPDDEADIGEPVTFTTAADGADNATGGNETEEPFGERVSALVHELRLKLRSGDLSMPLGHLVAGFVTENNPGNAPEGAGPPEGTGPPDDDNGTDDGNETVTDDADDEGDDGERGPPEGAGPPDDGNETDDGGDDHPGKGNGPPDHANDDEDDGDDDDDDEEDDSSDRGKGNGNGKNDGKGNGHG